MPTPTPPPPTHTQLPTNLTGVPGLVHGIWWHHSLFLPGILNPAALPSHTATISMATSPPPASLLASWSRIHKKVFPFSPHHPPQKKMMLSTGTWAKFSYLGFRVLWLRKYREPSSFRHVAVLSAPPWSGCFTSLPPTQKPDGNTCWASKQLDWPTYKAGVHRKFVHPPLLPGEREEKENNNKSMHPSKKNSWDISCAEHRTSEIRSQGLGTPCLKVEISQLSQLDSLAICSVLFPPPEETR